MSLLSLINGGNFCRIFICISIMTFLQYVIMSMTWVTVIIFWSYCDRGYLRPKKVDFNWMNWCHLCILTLLRLLMIWQKDYFYQTKGSWHLIMKAKVSLPETTESKLNGKLWWVTSLSKSEIFNLELPFCWSYCKYRTRQL